MIASASCSNDQGRFWGKLNRIRMDDVDLRQDEDGTWTVQRGDVVHEVHSLDEALATAWKLLDEDDEQ